MNQSIIKQFQLTINSHKPITIIMLGLILAGIVLRIGWINQIPQTMYWDEVAIFIDAKLVAQTGKDMHGVHWLQPLFYSYGDFKLPVYIWFTSLFAKFIQSDIVVRLPNLIVGLLSFIIIADLGLKLFVKSSLFDNRYATNNKDLILVLSVLTVLSVSPWSIMFARTGFEAHLSQFLLTLSVWILVYAKPKPWLVLVSVFFGILAIYTYYSTRFVWPVLFVTGYLYLHLSTPIYNLSEFKWIKPIINTMSISILGLIIFGLGLLPMTSSPHYSASQQFRLSTPSVLDMTQPVAISNSYREMIGESILERMMYHRFYFMGKAMLNNVFDHLGLDFLFVTGESNMRHSTGKHGLLLLSMLPLLFFGLYSLVKENMRALLFLGIWWITALIPASIPLETPHALRSLNALTPIVLIIGYGLYWLLKKTAHKPLIGLSFLLIIGLNTLAFGHYYINVYPEVSKDWWQYSYKQVVDNINRERVGNESVIVKPLEGRHYLWFLAYGSLSPQEIQNLEIMKNDVKRLGNITFDPHLSADYIFAGRE